MTLTVGFETSRVYALSVMKDIFTNMRLINVFSWENIVYLGIQLNAYPV